MQPCKRIIYSDFSANFWRLEDDRIRSTEKLVSCRIYIYTVSVYIHWMAESLPLSRKASLKENCGARVSSLPYLLLFLDLAFLDIKRWTSTWAHAGEHPGTTILATLISKYRARRILRERLTNEVNENRSSPSSFSQGGTRKSFITRGFSRRKSLTTRKKKKNSQYREN